MTPAKGDRSLGIVITYPYPIGERSTGGPRTLREIAWGLADLGDRVHVLTLSSNMERRVFPRPPVPPERLGRAADDEYRRRGVELVRVPQHPLHFHLDGLPIRQAVERITRRETVDVVLGHYHEVAFLPRFLRARGIALGYLATWQTYAPLARPLSGIGGAWWRWIRRRTILEPALAADLHIAISRFTRRELIDILGIEPQRIAVCRLGVDRAFGAVERRPPTAIRRLIYFGRFAPSKGFADAMDALGRLAARGQRDWTFRLFGDGRRDLVEEAARRHGIADRVEVRAAVDDEELRRQLAWADLALLPSHSESFGLSIAEAQAAGLPVVAYDAGAIPELVKDGVTGWLAPLGDTAGLSDRLAAAMADPARCHRVGLAARERVTSDLTWERTARSVHDALAGVV